MYFARRYLLGANWPLDAHDLRMALGHALGSAADTLVYSGLLVVHECAVIFVS